MTNKLHLLCNLALPCEQHPETGSFSYSNHSPREPLGSTHEQDPQFPAPLYRTTNWPSYNAALKAHGSLTICLDKHMQCFSAASGKRWRCPKSSDTAIQFCLSIKNFFALALRQAVGFVQSFLHLSGQHWPVPDFSLVCRRQRSLQVHVSYRSSQAGLHLLVDSTGIKFLGDGEWKFKKHAPER